MRGKDTAYLIDYTYKDSDYSDEGKRVAIERKVYANMYDMSLDSKLLASREGLRVQGRFEMYSFEYYGESDVKVDNQVYTILSADKKGEDKILITYGERLGNNGLQ